MPTPRQRLSQRLIYIARHHLRPLAILLVVLLAARSSLADWNDVPTGSMNPTILEGDRVFVNKLAYGLKVPFTTLHLVRWHTPERGQVVVFYAPHDGTRMVKRVIAVPGDTVEMRNGVLIVNGQPSSYAPLDPATIRDLPPRLASGHVLKTETGVVPPHPLMLTPGQPGMRSFDPVTVPAGKYLMLGDNRDNSLDSRYWGFVDEDQIVGQATGIAMSFDPAKTISPRWGRFLRGMP